MNRPISILLVEDDRDAALLLSLSLNEACGPARFVIRCVERLAEAKEALGQERFDAVILDLTLPDSKGLDTLRAARRAARGVPIVVLTGLEAEPIGTAAIDEGAQDFLSKDQLDPANLRRAVGYALGRARLSSQLERLAEASADALFVVGADAAVLYVNPAACALMGRSVEELRGKPFPFPLDGGARLDVALPAQGAEERLGEMRLTEIEWQGEPARLASVRDMSELRRFEALRAEIRERRKMDKLKDRVLSTVSHELRTPLTVVSAAVANLRDGLAGPLTSEGEQMVGLASKNLERLGRVVNNLLDFSRLESGRASLSPKAVSLSEAVDDAVTGIRLANRSAAAVAARLPENLPALLCDPDMLQQVLHNLLDNALRHAASGVEVLARLNDGLVVVSVVDDGPGIPARSLPQLFDLFVQLERPAGGAGYKGTGLGLAICREAVRLNGGRLWAEPGPGGRFHFSLPQASSVEGAHVGREAADPGGR